MLNSTDYSSKGHRLDSQFTVSNSSSWGPLALFWSLDHTCIAHIYTYRQTTMSEKTVRNQSVSYLPKKLTVHVSLCINKYIFSTYIYIMKFFFTWVDNDPFKSQRPYNKHHNTTHENSSLEFSQCCLRDSQNIVVIALGCLQEVESVSLLLKTPCTSHLNS